MTFLMASQMTFLRRLRPLDLVLVAATVAAIGLWLVLRPISGSDRTLEAAIDEAATAWASQGNLASARAMFALADVAEERAGDAEAARLLRAYALGVAYDDQYRSTAAIFDLFASDNPIAVDLVARYRELDDHTINVGPVDVDPAITQGIAAGLKSVDLTVPDAPGGFPESYAGLVDWQQQGAGWDLTLNGIVSFPSSEQQASIMLARGAIPYDVTIAVTLAGPIFDGASISHVDKVAFGSWVYSDAEPIVADISSTADLSFEVRVPVGHPETLASLASEPQLYFDLTLSDGRRVLLHVAQRNVGEASNQAVGQALAAWGLTPAGAD